MIPAAGLGTRFLPATKAMPKEMLPVVDKPAIQYVVEEAVQAHLDDIIMILGRNKNALADHFDRATELEHTLTQKGDTKRLSSVQEAQELADLHFVRQGDPLGLGHAVLRAKKHVGSESFAVMLGDDLIDARDPILPRMIAEHDKRQASVIALMEVSPEHIPLYGVAAIEPTDDPDVMRITDLVEKPSIEAAPSNLAVIGRYVLRPEVFPILERTAPGKGGEIQLTDALKAMAVTSIADPNAAAGPVFGVVFRGRRYDTGDKLDYIKAVVQLAAERPDLGPDLRAWLRDYVDGRPG